MRDLQAGPRGKGRIKEQGHPLHHSQPDPRAALLSHPILPSHPTRVPHPGHLSPNHSAPSPSPPGSCGFGHSPSTPGGHFWTQGAPEHGQCWDALLPASLQAKRTRRDEEGGIIPSSLLHLLPTSAPARLILESSAYGFWRASLITQHYTLAWASCHFLLAEKARYHS